MLSSTLTIIASLCSPLPLSLSLHLSLSGAVALPAPADDHRGPAGRAAHAAGPEPAAPAGEPPRRRREPRAPAPHGAHRGELPAAAAGARAAGQGAFPAAQDPGGDGAAHRQPEADAGLARRVHQEAAGDAPEQGARRPGGRGGGRRWAAGPQRGRGAAGPPGDLPGAEGKGKPAPEGGESRQK